MANNKFYGYTPKKNEVTTGWEEKSRVGNSLDKVNPYEFRKGMDYELTAIGCSRLAESTIEEREKATETVLKNLEDNGGYYTSLITYETLFRNTQGVKPSFKAWLKEQDEFKMKEVSQTYKNDKMTEPKVKSQEISTKADIKPSPLEETIKRELKKILSEKKMEEQDDDMEIPQDVDDDKADKAATKGARKVKGDRFAEEKEALESILFKGKGGDEYNSKNPAPSTLKQMAKDALGEYSKKYKEMSDGLEQYNAYLSKLNTDKIFPKLEKIVEKLQKKYDKESNQTTITLEKVYAENVDTKGYKGPGRLPDTIKLIEKRLEELKKEEESDVTALEGIRRNVAETDMTREEHIKLLEICKQYGVNLREGSMGVKMYYEIAKAAYLEGLANGLKL